jgi:ubiquitin carboxyl-terminal hydrolase 5/13
LWLCLTCGSLGCGRQQFGGVAGNGHGLAHFEASGHAISVKLGTITPEGDAGSFFYSNYFLSELNISNIDIYCYVCNDSKRDPELPVHLASFGINVETLSKTEKNMTELVWICFLLKVSD